MHLGNSKIKKGIGTVFKAVITSCMYVRMMNLSYYFFGKSYLDF
jgi:hypothetical protein